MATVETEKLKCAPQGFDSVKGNTKGTDVYIVYANGKSYPRYLIEFSNWDTSLFDLNFDLIYFLQELKQKYFWCEFISKHLQTHPIEHQYHAIQLSPHSTIFHSQDLYFGFPLLFSSISNQM